jgi:putative exporter of polyketide antibiotics
MTWWFLILGVSTLVVVCVAIALYMRIRRHLQDASSLHEASEAKNTKRASGEP